MDICGQWLCSTPVWPCWRSCQGRGGGVRREGEEKIEEETNREELERLMTTVRGVTRAHDWMWVVEQAKAAGSTEAQNDHLKFSRDVAYSKCLTAMRNSRSLTGITTLLDCFFIIIFKSSSFKWIF